MPSRKAVRADDKRLAEPGKKRKKTASGRPAEKPRTRMERWEAGLLKISDMTDKELKKGWFANEDGSFKGGRPRSVPRKFSEELNRERLRRLEDRFTEYVAPALETLDEIRKNPRAPADARYKSAVYLIERGAGKVPEKSEVKVEVAKWEENIEGLLFEDPDEKAG